MDEQERNRKRKIARGRIVEQFGDVLNKESIIVVDCGPDLGHAVVLENPEATGYDIRWLKQIQVRTLAGRID